MAAVVGLKDLVQVYVGDSENITLADKLVHVKTITFPQSEAEEIDVTDFDSDGKETVQGLIDYGNLEFTQHLTEDEYNDMQDRQDANKVVYFQAFALNTTGAVLIGRKGKGFLKTVAPEGLEMNSAFTVKSTIRVVGATSKVEELPVAGV